MCEICAQTAWKVPVARNGTPSRDPAASTASTRQLTGREGTDLVVLLPSDVSSSERYSDDSSSRGLPSQACIARSLGSGRPGVKLRVPPFWLRPAITDGRVFLLNLLTNKDLFERIQTSLLTKVHHSLGTRRPFSLPGPAWNFGETAGPFDLLGVDCRLMSYKLEEASKSHTCDPLCHFFGKRLPLRCW